MSREHTARSEILEAIGRIPSLSELLSAHEGQLKHELDLEVMVYGRNYGGKKVGPYVRLLTYAPGESIINEGDWGGNTFYVVVDGQAEVYLKSHNGKDARVAELPSEAQFGEMSLLAGGPRNATVKAANGRPVQVLEIQRPALRLLRKLPAFSEALNRTYRSHGRNASLQDLKAFADLSSDQIEQLKGLSRFRVFSKNHVLFREKTPVQLIYVIIRGWVRRSRYLPAGTGSPFAEDFLGKGFCFGLEGLLRNDLWSYTVTVLARTEVLEIPIRKLRETVPLRGAIAEKLSPYIPPAQAGDPLQLLPGLGGQVLASQEILIESGLVDGTNLLVMDMDLCVRCGNCSLACHRVHGRSRLVRRGIHLHHPQLPKTLSLQTVLAPAVCLHCQDPECLTGCPTGAIGRFQEGLIDINTRTCIGCGDCATQCPYDAIAMVPRQASKPAASQSITTTLGHFFRLRLDPLPAAVQETDDLLAVKCNLCENTPLNPPGSKRPAYSCEENCPTGALARIHPVTYFEEIRQIQGLLFLDPKHAVGRNIHKSDPPKRWIHFIGLLLTLVLTAATIIGIERYGLGERLLGFLNMRWITGLVGLAGVLGVMAYPIRRQLYRQRAGPLRYWMLVHAYLGVVGAITLLLHGGTGSGGALTTALMISFDLVILTGLFGILCYATVPRLLTAIEGTPLLMEDLLARRKELQGELAEIQSTCTATLQTLLKNRVIPRFVSLGYLFRQYGRREDLELLLESARTEFRQAEAGFTSDRERGALHRAVEAAATLRRVDALIYLHRLLKAWLPPHVVFSSLMLALMLVHILQVIYFAARW